MKMQKKDGQNQSGGHRVIDKELDRQFKGQFIHGLNDSDMLAEIIRELTKTDENMLVTI